MIKSKSLISLILFLNFLLTIAVKAEVPIKSGDILNLEKCIEIALQRHPDIIAAFYKVKANKSKVGQAQANYYPQLTGTYNYSRISSFGNSYSGENDLFTGGMGERGPFDQYFTGINLNQEIFNFGKTSTKVAIQKLNQESSQFDLKNMIEAIVFNVRQCYYE
ncbi:MAG: TolC family protein, partial [Desulfobacterota bacterium]|nr:TolC family protein [Thermodesulfobacteriota bacterium]